ncbi:MAG TPA: hypothetical protein VFJ64_01980, partial [Solirubrobacterales bacterium]|nr:hypothetical protein [Solirubrobacterales bacterium]
MRARHLCLCLLVAGLAFPSLASAKEGRLSLAPLGSFINPLGLAVDQSSHDVYAIGGRSEEQRIAISATAGQFKLKFGGKATKDLPFNAEAGVVAKALQEIVCGGKECVVVNGGGPSGAAREPYRVGFVSELAMTDVEQIECAPGTVPLSGGSGCSATTTSNGVNGSISRFHADGTPSEFTALGSNAIDGLGGPDLTPQSGLHFSPTARFLQLAVDESGGATDGEIYVTQSASKALDVFSAEGAYLGALSEYEQTPGNPATLKPLGSVCGVAVDAAGDVYLAENANGIHKYDPSSAVVANADNVANFTSVSQPCSLAAGRGATAGSLFAVSFSGEKLFKLDASTGEVKYGGNPIAEGNTTIAVDPKSGHVLAAAHSPATGDRVTEWDASGEGSATLLGSVQAGSFVDGVAVDGSTAKGKGGTLYLSREKVSHLDVYSPIVVVPDVATEAASGIGPAVATLHGTISAAEGVEAHCHFQYLPDSAYQAQKKAAEEASKAEPKTKAEITEAAFAGAQSAPCSPAGPFTGAGLNAVSAKVEGLAHETAYRFRIVGENEEGQSAAEAALSFETFGKPKVKGGLASEVTTTSAKVAGEVNPGGQATSFAVQYVSQAEFLKSGYNNAVSVPEPVEAIGLGTSFLEVSAQLVGLTPDTAYRFRIAATNADGTTFGKEGAFASFAPPEGPLDQRAYELVSPVPRMGEVFTPEPGPRAGMGGSCKSCTPGWNVNKAPMQSSPDGDAVAYEGDPFSTGLPPEANSYVSRRTEAGWQTAALSEPQFETQDFKGFSPDLSKAVIEQAEPPLSAEAPPGYDDLYLREEGKGLTTLITTKPPSRSPGTGGENPFQIDYAGANAGSEAVPAFTHVIFQANDALTEAV